MSDKYQAISDDDRKKATTLFDKGRQVASSGNFDYGIEMFVQGLLYDPENIQAHQELREYSLKRKASGGKSMGFLEARKFSTNNKDDKLNLINAEKLLAYDPGNTDYMLKMLQNAHRAGAFDTVMWIGPILQKANADAVKKPDFDKFIALKDVYKSLASDTGTPPKIRPELWQRATTACHYAVQMKPEDMDLQTELKNLGANHTMDKGNYSEGGSFRDSMQDRDSQEKLLEQDKDHQSSDSMSRFIREAEAQLKADPNEAGKLFKLVDALEKTEDMENENRAIEMLSDWYHRTKQFRFRKRIGEINMRQWSRMERGQRDYMAQNPTDEGFKKEYEQFRREKLEFELGEYQVWAENYPTDMSFRFMAAERMFYLGKYDDTIPLLQDAQRDAKYRNKATILLGRSFFEAQFMDESISTLDALIKEYQLKGDDNSKEMYYWCGRAYEARGDKEQALKLFSQIMQWEFRYRDVQKRVRELRAPAGGAAQG